MNVLHPEAPHSADIYMDAVLLGPIGVGDLRQLPEVGTQLSELMDAHRGEGEVDLPRRGVKVSFPDLRSHETPKVWLSRQELIADASNVHRSLVQPLWKSLDDLSYVQYKDLVMIRPVNQFVHHPVAYSILSYLGGEGHLNKKHNSSKVSVTKVMDDFFMEHPIEEVIHHDLHSKRKVVFH